MRRLTLVLLTTALIQGSSYKSGNVISVVSSLPATCNIGEVVILNTGSVGVYSCTSTNTWTSGAGIGPTTFIPLLTFTTPSNTGFSWTNQGGATLDTTNGYLYVLATGNTRNARLRTKTAPATPYTITAAFFPDVRPIQYHEFGLIFRESSSGKYTGISLQYSSVWNLGVSKWDSPTAFSANYVVNIWDLPPAPIWFRITDDGTNRICSYSFDGAHYLTYHTVGRTDYLTANEVGFFVDSDSTADLGVTVASWQQS